MICSNCNTMNADGMKFCGNCGAPLGNNNKGGGGLKIALIAV